MAEFSHRSLHGATAGRRRLLAVTVLVVGLLVFDTLSGGILRSGVRSFSARVWTSSAHMREAVTSGGYFVRQRTLATENLALKDELAQYREKAAGYDVLYQENMQLRTMLHLADKHQGITAPVVSSTGSSPYGTFLIGAGTNDPVREGDVVLTDGDFVVGLVTDVLGRTSAVRALFSAGVQTDVIIAGAAVTAVGDGGGNAHASVPRGIVVHEGDAVIAGIYGGRAIGVVGKVESAPTSADQTVYIRLPVDLSSLRYVYILHS